MQTQNKILDDLSRVTSGAMSAMSGFKHEVEAMIKHKFEAMIADLDFVPREEFEAVKAMAAEARAQQEKLEKRVKALEGKTGKAPAAAKPAAK